MRLKQLFVIVTLALFSPSLFSQTVSTVVFDIGKRFEATHWHPDGRIYSVDYYNGRMYQIHLDGTVDVILSGFSALSGGGFDADGNFYISGINTGEIFRVDGVDDYTTVSEGYNQPVIILQSLVDPDLFYVSEYGDAKVSTFSMSTGVRSEFVEGNGLLGPDGMLWLPNGNLLVANWENHKIHTITLAGEVSLFADLAQAGNMGYMALVGDKIYVASVDARKIFELDLEGNISPFAGSDGFGADDGMASEATFIGPNGICKNPTGDTLLIGDRNRVRMITNFGVNNITSESVELKINVYPNPSSDTVNLDLSQFIGIKEIYLLDLSGKIVGQRTSKNEKIVQLDLRAFKAGQYYIHVDTEAGTFNSEVVLVK